MLKRVVSSVVSVACLLSATGAFAATNYQATKTEYYANNQIKVTSTISGENGDTATYLVYDKSVTDVSEITGTDIVYVDQYKFTGSEENNKWTFSYVTDNSNIGATIKVGNGATSEKNAPTAIPGISYPVTVTCGENTWETTGMTDADETGWVKIPFSTTQSLVEKVTLNGTELGVEKWFTGADALWICATWDNNSNKVVVTAKSAATTVKMDGMTYLAGAETENPDGYTDPSIVAVATVTGSSENVGIILASNKENIQNYVSGLSRWNGESATDETNKTGIFPALGVNNDGKFAIRIYDDTVFTADSTWYAVAYYKDSTGIHLSGNCMEITVPTAE